MEAKDAISAHKNTYSYEAGTKAGQNLQIFWDTLHIAQPYRFSILAIKKNSDQSHFARLKPGAKFIREEMSVLSICQLQKKYSYEAGRWDEKSAQDSSEGRTMCALPAPG
mgnify:CR=1 FL=1